MNQPDACDLCGEPVPEDAWFGLEVQRPAPSPPHVTDDDFTQLDVIFCSKGHAATWLAGPIPDPEPVTHPGPVADRLIGLGCAVIVAVVLGLLAVGVWTVAGWVA